MSASPYTAQAIDATLENFDTAFVGLKSTGKTAFVFSGHGTEWVGMGQHLLDNEPVFLQTIERCAAAHKALFPSGAVTWDILEEMRKPAASSRMGESGIAHPCLVALEIGLVELLKSRGIRADAVVGHSVGEVAAAYCAGYLDIEGAFRAVHYQSEVMDLVRGKGRMLFIAKPVGELEPLLYRYAGQLSVAAVNSHGGAVVSGTEAVLKEILAEQEAAGVFARMLKMDIPFHSHTMLEYIDKAPSGYAQISVLPGTLPFFSTVSGQRAGAGDFDGAYWARHISEPVLFADAIDLLAADGCNVFVEIGPHAAHGKDLSDAMEHNQVAEFIITGTLRREANDELELAASIALAHTRGFPVETAAWPERSRAVFDQVLGEMTARIAADQASGRLDPSTWKSMGEEERREALLALVQRLVGRIAKVPADKLADQEAGFMSLGINSIMSVQLKELLARELDLSLPNTLIFDYPSQSRLVEFLSAQLGGVQGGMTVINRAWQEVDDFLASLEGLSDQEAERRIEEEVERIRLTEGLGAGLQGAKKVLYLLKQEQLRREPIAIVGMACRLPAGANDLDGYWRLLVEQRDGTSEIPLGRWDNSRVYDRDKTVPGKSYVKRGGFLTGVDPYEFDPFFFKISPKEAEALDPQQRMILEVTYEAFLNAGIPLESLMGSNAGSYLGICSTDFQGAHVLSYDATRIDAYSLLGSAFATAGGRISFTWGMQGPAVSIDTACSSSLIAMHMAMRGIRNGECDLAVVGGVNALLHPNNFIYFSKLQAVSPDGLCKTFDASANGYARAEGCGVLILKRLSQAIEDNDNIIGLARGSAINQDGASSGFTAPNGIAQQDLLRRALRDAGLKPEDIDYVETHGTGTPLGDPIEMGAVAAVYGEGHDKATRPLIVGSVKSSIGHLEGGAGVSGMIKILLSMQHGGIPANLHFRTPNPDIDWDNIPVVVPTNLVPWQPQPGKPRLAGVSGFGFSGSNAHVILQDYPPREPAHNEVDRTAHLLAVSAKDGKALNEYVQRYAAYLREHADTPLGDIAYTSTTGRDHYNNRLTVVASSHAEMADALDKLLQGDNDKRLRQGTVAGPHRGKVAFLFTGQGSQYFGMGRELYQTNRAFRERLDACAAVLDPLLGQPLIDILYNEDGDQERVNQTAYTQPAIFAVEYALYGLWESFGVQPHFVMGHSVGEYVAAVVSGLMSLEDGCRLIAERGRLMNALPAGGVMAAVFAPRETIEELIAPWSDRLSLAAHNSPGVNTVAGEASALEEAMSAFEERKIKARKLVVSHAFHSHLMDPMLEEFAAFAAGISFREPRIPLISNVTCQPLRLEEVTPEYWCRHVRGTVGFHDSMQTLQTLGANVFVEVGADVTLAGLGKQCLPGYDAIWVSSLKRKSSDWEQMLQAVAELHNQGVGMNWKGLEGHYERRKVILPLYPYQRKRYYMSPYIWPDENAGQALGTGALAASDAHPLLGSALPSPMAGRLYLQRFDLNKQGFLADHVIYGMPIVAGTCYLEVGFQAARDVFGGQDLALRDVNFKEAFVLLPDKPRDVQHVVSEQNGQWRLQIYSRPADATTDGEGWKGHVDLGLTERSAVPDQGDMGFDPAQLMESLPIQASGEEFYAMCESMGYTYTNRHHLVNHMWWNEREALSHLVVPPGDDRFAVDPGVLDSIIQVFIATHVGSQDPASLEKVVVPVHIDWLAIDGPLEGELWAHFHIHEYTEERRSGHMVIQDAQGRVVACILGATAQAVNAEVLKRAAGVGLDHMLWATEWRPVPKTQPGKAGQVILLLGRDDTPAAELADKLSADHTVLAVAPGASYHEEGSFYQVNPLQPADFAQLIDSVLRVHGQLDAVVCGWALGCDAIRGEESLRRQQQEMLGSAFHLAQAVAGRSLKPRFVLLSQEAFTIDGSEAGIQLPQTGIYGFGNAAELEFEREFPVLRVDLGRAAEDEISALVHEITGGDAQSRLALRGAERYAAKLVPLKQAQQAADKGRMPYPAAENFFLDTSGRGILDNLEFVATPIAAPGPDDITLRVHATGLNFRDVLNALGTYPGDAGLFGLECAGVVTAVGQNVTRLKVGDRVMASISGSFRQYLTCPQEYAVGIPEGISYEDAVTIPGPFLTAWYALVRKGGLKKGDKVLVHAGAGGVGIAAVQIALAAGAEVFATCSPPKQAFLRKMGVHHVHNSRTLDFADEIREITGGKGVDLILNSLAGDFIRKSFELMADNGRFIEIGKMGIWTNEQVKAFNPSLDYHAFDLAADSLEDPSLVESMFSELLTEFAEGRLEPLPKTVFPLHRTVDAFRYMAQARHIGKIVVTQAEDVRRERIARQGLTRPDATYMLTGGLGALGLVFADWLVENGARHLALLGRSKPKAEAEKKMAEWTAKGVNVRVLTADASDKASLSAAVAVIDREMAPLRGVLHLAGLLDDGMISSSNWERFERVLESKIYGGWYLHELTRHRDLDLFLMFSSIAALFGNRGQANYAAANAFLDGLVHWRREQGMAGTTVNWGPWGEVGMATDAKRAEIIARSGFYNIALSDGLQVVGDLLRQDWPQAGVAELNLPVYLGGRSDNEKAGFYEDLASRLGKRQGAGVAESAAVASGAVKRDFWVELASADPGERKAVMAELIKVSVASVLKFKNTDDIDSNRPFRELGFDSLTNAEFINHLDKTLQAGLTQSLYMEYPTVSQMADFLVTMPAITEKLETVVVPDASQEAPAPAAPKAPVAPPKPPPSPRKSNGKHEQAIKPQAAEPKARPAVPSSGQGELSYTSPVRDLSDARAIEDQTDRYLKEHLSAGKKADDGERKSWWQRLVDALGNIES